MKLTIFFLAFILAVGINSYSQELYFNFHSGIGSYSMNELDRLNNLTIKSMPFDTELVSDFPPYVYFQPSLLVKYDKAALGLVYNYSSTGSRISGKDYSGEYRFDMTTLANSFGICGNYKFLRWGKLEFLVNSTIGISMSVLKINEYLSLGDTVLNNDDIRFNSYGFYFEPSIYLVYNLKRLKIGLNGGYSINFNNVPLYYEKKGNQLTIENSQITPDWSGFRFGISISYPIVLDLFDL